MALCRMMTELSLAKVRYRHGQKYEIHLTVVQGQICCRFENDSPYLSGLGDFFAKRQTSNFPTFFEIESDLDRLHTHQVGPPVMTPIPRLIFQDPFDVASYFGDATTGIVSTACHFDTRKEERLED